MAIPAIGSHELNVLTPTILELQLVTTKDPDPATVSQWNFVGPNFALSLPSASEFQVTVGGTPVSVVQVGFKRRPLYAPLRTRDLRIGNHLYLKLATAVAPGQTVVVRNASKVLWDDSKLSFSTGAAANRFNPALHVNQMGYMPGASKKAMVGYYLGSLGELDITATSFQIINAATGQAVFSGSLRPRLDVGYSYTPKPYQKVLEADFTAFNTPGEYRLMVPGMGVSFPFLIDSGIAAAYARTYALGLYHQRCGMANEMPHTRHEHGICHAAPATFPTLANTAVNNVLAGETWNYLENPLHTAPRLENVNASLYPFVKTSPIDVSRGHHDAGDYSKYTINSAGLIHHLVFAADSFTGAGRLDNLGLPESGDGKSDLLQEAKWEADFLAKMQDSDGGFYFLVYPRDRRYEDDVLPDQGDPQVVFPKTTAVTAAAVAALAEIGSSPTFKAQFPTEAATYLAKAKLGWNFLMQAIARHGKNGSYQKITHYGNEFMHDDELSWAAAAMFTATGESQYHTKLIEWYDPSDPNTRRWTWWRLFEGYGSAARAYAFAARSGRLSAGQLNATYLAKCEAEIIAAGDDIARFAEQTAYGTSFPDPNKSFRTAGWYFSSERAFELATAHQLRASSRYLDAIASNLGYEAGCNPVNVSYITGVGFKRWRDIVHQYALNDQRVLPPSGIPLGNIQGGFAYLENYKQELGALCYPPDGASSAPYPFYDRWGDSFNTTTEFVVVDQARALATASFLLARTGDYNSPSKGTVGVIQGIPASIPANEPVTATFSASGLDLSKARIVWEASGQEPFIGSTFKFSPKNPGDQWVEVEAQLPDGRRVFAKAAFSATFPRTGNANSHLSTPLLPSMDMAALYHMDGTLNDAMGRSPSLKLAGNASVDNVNLGWMQNQSGGALHFHDLGDKATVTIPGAYLKGSGATEIAIEAMVYVHAYKGWNRGAPRLMSLVRSWNASLEWMEDTYSGPHVRGGTQFDMSGAALAAAMPVQKWHHLSIAIGPSGYSARVNGKEIASAPSIEFSGWSGGDAVLEIGNFEGWMDELVIIRRTSSPSPSPSPTASATFKRAESMTGSFWKGVYGGEGYSLHADATSLPTWAQVSTANANSWTWRTSTTELGPLERAKSSERFAAAWFSGMAFDLNVNLTDGQAHNVTLYCIDYQGGNQRAQRIDVLDKATGALLHSTNIASFRSGRHLTWSIRGSVVFRFTSTGLYNAVLSGIFIDSAVNGAPSVEFQSADVRTQGNWKPVYGSLGYIIMGDSTNLPPYVHVSGAAKTGLWKSPTTEICTPERDSSSERLAACWTSADKFTMRVNLPVGEFHGVSLYCMDYYGGNTREQRIEVLDPGTGAVLDSVDLSKFSSGVYLTWKVQGTVDFRVTRTSAYSAVISGLFID